MKSALYSIAFALLILEYSSFVVGRINSLDSSTSYQTIKGQPSEGNVSDPVPGVVNAGSSPHPNLKDAGHLSSNISSGRINWLLSKLHAAASWMLRARAAHQQASRASLLDAGSPHVSDGNATSRQQRRRRSLQVNYQAALKELWEDFEEEGAAGDEQQESGGQQVASGHKRCHPDCTRRGNCNLDTGQCECPYGLAGRACSQLLLPACRLVNLTLEEAEAQGQSLLLTCAQASHRNCECYRQCRKLLCDGSGTTAEDCDMPFHDALMPCYEYRRLPPEQQVSVFPQPEWEAITGNVSYWYGFADDMAVPRVRVDSTRFDGSDDLDSKYVALPLERCNASCHHHGSCQQLRQKKGPAYCSCYTGWTGPDCGERLLKYCPLNCSGRGTCTANFCHCQPPYWGLGCTRDTAAVKPQHAPVATAAPGPFKIFMYDLPPSVAFLDAVFPGWTRHDPIYTSWRSFLSTFLQDWAVRTQDPWAAHLFYVPALTYHYSGNLGVAQGHMQRVVRYIRQQYPFWDRHGGRDHFFWLANDRGGCDGTEPAWAHIHPAIKLVHFGAFNTTAGLQPGKKVAGLDGTSCFRPSRDVVAPPYQELDGDKARSTYGAAAGGKTGYNATKTLLLFFAGRIDHNAPEYSGSVRQALHKYYGGAESGSSSSSQVVIREGFTLQYERLMSSAKFCLAPYGHGWGIRLGQVMLAGCVPVIIQDHIFQPFEDLLPYEQFSLRLPAADIPRIQQVLAAVSEAEWQRLHAGLARWHRAFVWEPGYGWAYNLTIRSLRGRHAAWRAGLAED